MTTEFRYSRRVTAVCLIVSVALSALGFAAFEHPAGMEVIPVWLLGLFIAATVAFAWMLVSPRRLILDEHGFTMAGGFAWRPTRYRWQQVGEFYVSQRAKGGEEISFKLKQPPRDYSRLADSPSCQQDGSLPPGWNRDLKSVVQELNRYRARTIGGSQASGPSLP